MLGINRAPLGLLELLGLKGTGDTPRSLSDVLSGVLNMDQYYLAPLRGSSTANTSTINSTGAWAMTTPVPAGELWLVDNISYTAGPLAAGESYTVLPGILWGTSYSVFGDPVAFPALSRVWGGVSLPQPVLCPPATTFYILATQVTAGASAFTVYVNFYRLRF